MSGRNPNAEPFVPNNGNFNLSSITGNAAVAGRQHELAALAAEEEGIIRGPYFHSLSASNKKNFVDQLTPKQLNMYKRERASEKRQAKVSRKNRKSRKSRKNRKSRRN